MGRNQPEMKFATLCVLALALAAVVQSDELKDLSSADVAAPVETASLEKTDANPDAVAETKKSDLGEGFNNAFSGALLTSGSFTMMASAAYEEEEELGEGEGFNNAFSGALLTSGSFTMMASAAY